VEEHFFALALALQFGASGGGKTSTVRDIGLQRGHCAVCFDLYQPTPPRFGDAGQGSSRWTPGQSSQPAPPQDDGGDFSDDDDGDYTRFYRHFGM
jgi:hypothetical protein